ncbi:Vps51/Vps67-domain-containing protein [Corynascus novoguineensis]|uniref:Vacuolar protein sorting-associated protein 51 homolog n=1 Tax=Corynascus novoguineensis TaxID=1126955 RepID=A0AAN7CY28_9PEZI|nr:Vps51/Vps67-domain-containing protein [Corynascus novoguineensis]
MSTIASPRDPSAPFPRRANSSIITPTSSTRPSLDVPASASSSPNLNSSATGTTSQSKRSNRAALREYYNLRNTTNKPLPSTPTVEVTDSSSSQQAAVGPPPSELDSPDFDAQSYMATLLATAPLADLLKTYASVLGEMRALDAERKALVYDNYSKLIAATETIRRMRGAAQAQAQARGLGSTEGEEEGAGVQDQLGRGTASSLEGVVEGIYRRAAGLREDLRTSVAAQARAQGDGGGGQDDDEDKAARRKRTRELAREVIKVPDRLKRLVEEGKVEQAKREWETPRKLLTRWKELGIGGEDTGALIEEGDALVRETGEKDEKEGGNSTA